MISIRTSRDTDCAAVNKGMRCCAVFYMNTPHCQFCDRIFIRQQGGLTSILSFKIARTSGRFDTDFEDVAAAGPDGLLKIS